MIYIHCKMLNGTTPEIHQRKCDPYFTSVGYWITYIWIGVRLHKEFYLIVPRSRSVRSVISWQILHFRSLCHFGAQKERQAGQSCCSDFQRMSWKCLLKIRVTTRNQRTSTIASHPYKLRSLNARHKTLILNRFSYYCYWQPCIIDGLSPTNEGPLIVYSHHQMQQCKLSLKSFL